MRSCVDCYCQDTCYKLAQFCKEMVFRMGRVDMSLIENMATHCPKYLDLAAQGEEEPAAQPALYLIKGGSR